MAGIKHFGSWKEAIEAAGFDYDAIRLHRSAYRKHEICKLLRTLARERPAMTLTELFEHPAHGAIQKLFGSLTTALRSARLEGWPKRTYERWDRARVIRVMRAQARRGIAHLDGHLGDAAIRYFGSVREARDAARVPQMRASWSREVVIAELRARAARGAPLDRNLSAACERIFGGVVAARLAAGVNPPPPKWSRDRVIAEIGKATRAGKLIIAEPLASACIRYFGRISTARAAAGSDEIIAQWPRRILIDVLRVTHENRIRGALVQACIRHFGSVAAARHYTAGRT
ncbi:MAG: hypothetical protein KF773_20490 [Deltaproteobacteria bacterium]|nr:hypothetical protein [Deltaproteobacteria bacterium]